MSAKIVTCPNCATANRVPAEKLGSGGKCGKCGAVLKTRELFEPQPIAISQYNFADKVLRSPLPVLVYAMSPTCPSCGVVGPHIEAFAKEHRGRIRVGRLNIQSSPELATRFDIMSVPYLLIFDRGQLQESMPGGLDRVGHADQRGAAWQHLR